MSWPPNLAPRRYRGLLDDHHSRMGEIGGGQEGSFEKRRRHVHPQKGKGIIKCVEGVSDDESSSIHDRKSPWDTGVCRRRSTAGKHCLL